MNYKLKHKDITGRIIGASFEVQKFLGNGFQEVICQRALAHELSDAGLSFDREIGLLINFGGKSLEFKRLILSPRDTPGRSKHPPPQKY